MRIQIFCNSTFYCDYITCIFAQCIKIVGWCTLFYPRDLNIYKLKPNNHMQSLSRLCQGMRHGRRWARGTYHFISRLLFLFFNIMCYRATVQAGHIKQSRALSQEQPFKHNVFTKVTNRQHNNLSFWITSS